MKKLLFSLLLWILVFSSVSFTAYSAFEGPNDLRIISAPTGESSNAAANDKLQDFNGNNQFIQATTGWEKALYNTLIRFARDLKNLFYAIATLYFLIISLKLIFANNTEEELGNFKKWILWITVGLIIMQLAYAFTEILFDNGVSAQLGANLIENLVYPMIALIQTLAAIFFIAMAIYAFYRLVTANGNEEAIKSGKMTILYALIGFMIVRFTRAIVEAFYGRINTCVSYGKVVSVDNQLCNRVEISEWINIIITVINWLNGFVAIVVLIMIIYAWAQIMLSNGDEEKIKKGKQSIIYIAIWLAVLVMNFLILTFFLRPEALI
jgi:hypothetical protein